MKWTPTYSFSIIDTLIFNVGVAGVSTLVTFHPVDGAGKRTTVLMNRGSVYAYMIGMSSMMIG